VAVASGDVTEPAIAPPPRILFIHVMKTAGTTLLTELRTVLPPESVWPADTARSGPDSEEHWLGMRQYASLSALMDLPVAVRTRLSLVAGHHPYALRSVLDGWSETEPWSVITLLRDPVARTLSHLGQLQRGQPEGDRMSLEAIYDEPWYLDRFLRDHQTRVFSMTMAEALAPRTDQLLLAELLEQVIPPSARAPDRARLLAMGAGPDSPVDILARLANELIAMGVDLNDVVDGHEKLRQRPEYAIPTQATPQLMLDASLTRPSPVDGDRLAQAKANLAACAVLGITEDYAGFVADLNTTLGLDCPAGGWRNAGDARQRQVPASFRARIRRDNALDEELVSTARDLIEARRR
jgi:hypothetical protein